MRETKSRTIRERDLAVLPFEASLSQCTLTYGGESMMILPFVFVVWMTAFGNHIMHHLHLACWISESMLDGNQYFLRGHGLP